MKKTTLLKSMLLLCALIVGSNAWATDILNEPFNISGTAEVSSPYNGWAVTRCWGGDGSIRLGASSGDKGQLITPALSTLSGGATLTFEVKKYGTDTGSIGISVAEGTGSVTGDVTVASSSISADAWTTKTVTITGGNNKTKIKFLMTNKRMYLRNVSIVAIATVPVTGVSLDKTLLDLEVGEVETLTPTIAPASATNKNVTWESSDEDVATVENGVVTAVGAGTAVITVTTSDGGFTDNCTVTVKAAPEPSVLFDFTSNNFGLPTSKTEAENSYSYGGYTVKLKGSSSNGYYYDSTNDNVLLGKNGATLTFPAFTFNVKKIKVYGVSTGSGSVAFNIYVGGDDVSTGVTGCKVDHEFNIAAAKQAAGTTYVLKITSTDNIRITKIGIYGYESKTIGTTGWSTYSSDKALDFENATAADPSSDVLEAYMVTGFSGTALTKSDALENVPGNTGLLLKGTAGETYNIPVLPSSSTSTLGNCLKPAVTATTVNAGTGDDVNYVLMNDGKDNPVFQWIGTTPADLGANKAYLTLNKGPKSAGARGLWFDDETTGLNKVEMQNVEVNGVYYNLAGQRVAQPTKGLYIVNGKKVVLK